MVYVTVIACGIFHIYCYVVVQVLEGIKAAKVLSCGGKKMLTHFDSDFEVLLSFIKIKYIEKKNIW